METRRTKQTRGAWFEYFLYTAIIAETGLAALVYKTIFRDPDLARFNLYFGAFYVAFLGWSMAQLNSVHRRRKLAEMETEGDPPDEIPATVPGHTLRAFGLSAAQLVVVVVVFVTALATFTWALKLLR